MSKYIYTEQLTCEEHLIIARWPERMPQEEWEADAIKDFELVQEIVRAIRNIRSEYKVEPRQKIDAILVSENKADMLKLNQDLLVDLAGINEETLLISQGKTETQGLNVVVVEDIEIFLDLSASTDGEHDRQRLEKELAEAESHVARLEKLLSSPFAQKAPEKVIEAEREKLAGYKSSVEKLRERLK